MVRCTVCVRYLHGDPSKVDGILLRARIVAIENMSVSLREGKDGESHSLNGLALFNEDQYCNCGSLH